VVHVAFWPCTRVASLVLAPYLVRVATATVLQPSIRRANR
jgi:tryptophan-rich sensory protein